MKAFFSVLGEYRHFFSTGSCMNGKIYFYYALYFIKQKYPLLYLISISNNFIGVNVITWHGIIDCFSIDCKEGWITLKIYTSWAVE